MNAHVVIGIINGVHVRGVMEGDMSERPNYRKIAERIIKQMKEGKINPKPCHVGKPGQVLQMLNCPYCQYAHYRWVDDHKEGTNYERNLVETENVVHE